jgi:acyl carrier protein
MRDLETAVKRVMADVFDLEPNAIREDASAENTPGWDSANHIQLVLALEQEFSISFDVAELESMLSFFDILQVMQSKL